jgi:hypothetical protein
MSDFLTSCCVVLAWHFGIKFLFWFLPWYQGEPLASGLSGRLWIRPDDPQLAAGRVGDDGERIERHLPAPLHHRLPEQPAARVRQHDG